MMMQYFNKLKAQSRAEVEKRELIENEQSKRLQDMLNKPAVDLHNKDKINVFDFDRSRYYLSNDAQCCHVTHCLVAVLVDQS